MENNNKIVCQCGAVLEVGAVLCLVCGTVLSGEAIGVSANDFAVGKTIVGQYEVVKLIGRGGMGEVYLGRDVKLDRTVAIKTLSKEFSKDKEHKARFVREARTASGLNHPNIITVYDFGGVGETLFIVTEYVEGKTLRKLVQEKGISLVQAVEIAVQIAEGLVAAHEAGIIHRDLKLENFILRPDNYVKILDFGLAKPVLGLVGNDKTNNFSDGFATGAGVILGTPNYMSPEQAKGKEIDARSDIFSFGAVLYELLAHHTAFEADNDIQTLFQVAFQEPEPLPSTIPLQLRKIVELALKKFVEARYQSMRELLSDLKEVQAELVDDRPEMEFKNSDTKGISPSPTSRRSFGIGSGAGMSGISSGKTGKLRSGTTERPSLTEPNYDYFVGRDREMMLLQSEFIRFQSGKGRPVLILGDTGTGKTLIVDNFKQWATKKGAVAVSSAFYNYGGSILQPYQTFLNIVHQALGIKVSQNVVSGLVMELWQPILSEVKARFGIELPYNFSTTQEGQEDKWKTFEIFREIFFQLALRQPLILIFDDLHAADALSFELIGYLLRNPSTSPVMMIFAADSQEASQAGSGLREWMVAQSKYFSFETIRLKPFNSKEIRKMLDAIFSRIEIADSEVSHLCEATGGNPYYLTEVVRLLVADGKIEQEEGWWKCKSLTNFELPASVGMAVQQQLKACQQDLYELLSQAAVLGESFRFETLAEISGKTDKELERLLSDAVKAGLFREEAANQGDDYSFSNTLIRRVLYDELSRRQRRKLHLTSATAIEEVFKGKLNRFLGQLTYHLSAAGEWRQAYDYGVRAIDQSWERNAWSELIRLAQMVEEAAEAIGQEEGDGIEPSGVMQIKLRAATAFMRQGKLMQAKEKAEEVFRIALQQKDYRFIGRAKDILCELNWYYGRFPEAMSHADEGIEAAKKAGDEQCERMLYYRRGWAAWRAMKLDDALRDLSNAFEMSESSGDKKLLALSQVFRGIVLHSQGSWHSGLNYIRQGIEKLRELGDKDNESLAYSVLTLVLLYERRHKELEEVYDKGIALARMVGWRVGEAYFYILRGLDHLAYTNLDCDQAADYLNRGFIVCQETGEEGFKLLVARGMGRLATLMEEFPQAIERLQENLRISRKYGALLEEISTLCFLGHAQEGAGLLEEALESYRNSYKLAIELKFLLWQWQALFGEARVLYLLGRKQQAKSQLSLACSIVIKLRNEFESKEAGENFIKETQALYDLLTSWN